jgi:hypothetical protein
MPACCAVAHLEVRTRRNVLGPCSWPSVVRTKSRGAPSAFTVVTAQHAANSLAQQVALGKGSGLEFASAPQHAQNQRLLEPALQPESPLIAEWPYSTRKRHTIWLCLDCVTECLKVAQLSSRKMTAFVRFVFKLPISCANLVPNLGSEVNHLVFHSS